MFHTSGPFFFFFAKHYIPIITYLLHLDLLKTNPTQQLFSPKLLELKYH